MELFAPDLGLRPHSWMQCCYVDPLSPGRLSAARLPVRLKYFAFATGVSTSKMIAAPLFALLCYDIHYSTPTHEQIMVLPFLRSNGPLPYKALISEEGRAPIPTYQPMWGVVSFK